MADSFTTLTTHISSRPLLLFLEALLLRKAAQTPMLIESTQNTISLEKGRSP